MIKHNSHFYSVILSSSSLTNLLLEIPLIVDFLMVQFRFLGIEKFRAFVNAAGLAIAIT